MRLEALEIGKSYGCGPMRVTALQPTSFSVEHGEFIAIVGPSGSGKSTLMNLIGLLDRPTSGRLLLDGVDCARSSPDALAEIRNRRLGFVFQAYHLLPRRTVLENVELPLVYAGLARAERRTRARQALELVGLERRLTHGPAELSGGEQQRVAIARALVSNPSLILADEPTGALDSATGRGILRLLQDCNDRGQTIVMVTHDREIAQQASRILSIRDGRLVSDEPSLAKIRPQLVGSAAS